MPDDTTIRRVLAILKGMIEAVEATLDAELEPAPASQPIPARKQGRGWKWYEELHSAIPVDWSNRKHFNRGDGWSACGDDYTRLLTALVDDPRRVWCGRCRNTIRWGDAATEVLYGPSTSATSPATATASSPSTSTH
jgi:hypothetical protein